MWRTLRTPRVTMRRLLTRSPSSSVSTPVFDTPSNEVTDAGTTKLVSFVQPPNASSPTAVSLPSSGRMFTSVNARSFRKALSDTVVVPPKSTRVRFEAFENAQEPIVSSESGRVTDVSRELSNAYSPIVRSEEGSVTVAMVAPANA